MTYKEIAALYNCSTVTLWRYLEGVKEELNQLHNTYIFRGRKKRRKHLNRKQIPIIVQAMKDTPEGYKLVRGQFIKLNDND